MRLIYVGRIWPQKNLPGLLRVLSQLHDASVPFTMTIVGDGPGLSALRRQVQSSSFAGQTRVLGAQRPDQVGRLLDANDFLLLTSHFEGTPHAVLEAMAHGLVAVASRLPGSTDRIITHGVDGYLCERERPGEYVNALQRFLDRPQDFGSLSRAARLTASSRYSTEALAARYEQLFGDLRRASLVAPKQIRDGITVPQALRPDFPGVFLQAKHRIADLWRFMAFGTRRVRWTSRQLNP